MNTPCEMKAAFEKAIELANGQSALARILSTPEKTVTQQRLWHWLKVKGVCPAEFVLRVEASTGVSRHLLRPDVFGEMPDQQAA
ncbi:transcriptional regulator [Pseudomonas sp. S9]|uniref:transcriptional regulator n=1 Tax=Pseudomonas sp. S9 TaxID=686578 RepID=UPI0002556FE7|nr:YdaS family helix-turn-helix protein [Pseudomonas sp. S9]